ncbi:RNA polymerase I enhancer binding protein, partial [Coemansia sp. RSA 25]
IYDHLFRHKTRDSTGKQLRKAFWPILAEALPRRQIQAIYHHVRRRCHPLNHLGAWTVDEDDALRRLVAAHGPAWEAISGEMGRMGTNCRDRWRYIQSQGAQNGGGRALAVGGIGNNNNNNISIINSNSNDSIIIDNDEEDDGLPV